MSTNYNAYSVKFSPFLENRIAVSTAQNFGIIGNGKQHIFDVSGCLVPGSGNATSLPPAWLAFRDAAVSVLLV